MRSKHALLLLALVILAASAIAACSDSSSPSGFACTGNTPDLAGAWSLLTINQGQGAIGPPLAHGTFVFTGDSVDVALTVPADTLGDSLNLAGTGKCTLTASKITITNFLGQGDATGPYTFKDETATPDTLSASIVSSGITTSVVVTRP
jgi:hypothetical protein